VNPRADIAAGPILLTGFEPFGGASVNASAVVVTALADRSDRIEGRILPVVAGAAESAAREFWMASRTPPSWGLSFGEADATPVVRLEWVAINWDDFCIPDNASQQFRAQSIRPGQPSAYFATIDLPALARDLSGETPVPVDLSLSAGSFLCNHLAYCLLDYRLPAPFAFVHLPAWRPEMGDRLLEDLLTTMQTLCEAIDQRVVPSVDGRLFR